jgi:hypothetical protein
MAGYSATPLWKKLGYKAGTVAHVDGGPGNYLAMLALPAEVRVAWLAKPGSNMMFVHVFAAEASVLKSKLKGYRKVLAANGVIWASWPKKSSGMKSDITEDVVRSLALPMGLVDIKVCAVDDVWSGLKLMIRKELRKQG